MEHAQRTVQECSRALTAGSSSHYSTLRVALVALMWVQSPAGFLRCKSRPALPAPRDLHLALQEPAQASAQHGQQQRCQHAEPAELPGRPAPGVPVHGPLPGGEGRSQGGPHSPHLRPGQGSTQCRGAQFCCLLTRPRDVGGSSCTCTSDSWIAGGERQLQRRSHNPHSWPGQGCTQRRCCSHAHLTYRRANPDPGAECMGALWRCRRCYSSLLDKSAVCEVLSWLLQLYQAVAAPAAMPHCTCTGVAFRPGCCAGGHQVLPWREPSPARARKAVL